MRIRLRYKFFELTNRSVYMYNNDQTSNQGQRRFFNTKKHSEQPLKLQNEPYIPSNQANTNFFGQNGTSKQ
jgi:hypothetical protein